MVRQSEQNDIGMINSNHVLKMRKYVNNSKNLDSSLYISHLISKYVMMIIVSSWVLVWEVPELMHLNSIPHSHCSYVLATLLLASISWQVHKEQI